MFVVISLAKAVVITGGNGTLPILDEFCPGIGRRFWVQLNSQRHPFQRNQVFPYEYSSDTLRKQVSSLN